MKCLVSCRCTHFHGLYSPLQLCCEGPWFTSIQEDECVKGAHQSYLGTEGNAPVVPYWFQSWQCCCRHILKSISIRLGILVRYNWTQVLEACDCFKLLFVYCDLLVDTSGVVCHQLDLRGTDLHVIGCGGFVEAVETPRLKAHVRGRQL